MKRISYIYLIGLLIVLLAVIVPALMATPIIVSDPSECPAGTIAIDAEDGRYECIPDPNYTPDPCTGPSSVGNSVSEECNPDPCNNPGALGNAANTECNPDPCQSQTALGNRTAVDCNPDPDPCQNPAALGNSAADVSCEPEATPESTPAPTATPAPPAGFSLNDTDLGVVLFNETDEDGQPVLEIYDLINDGTEGNYLFTITQDDLAPFLAELPEENTLLRSEGHVSVYLLTTGEIQLNIGPDSEGKIHVRILDGIPVTYMYGYVIEPAASE
jgi:hypothetical protein